MTRNEIESIKTGTYVEFFYDGAWGSPVKVSRIYDKRDISGKLTIDAAYKCGKRFHRFWQVEGAEHSRCRLSAAI